jgi:hypothetical protein
MTDTNKAQLGKDINAPTKAYEDWENELWSKANLIGTDAKDPKWTLLRFVRELISAQRQQAAEEATNRACRIIEKAKLPIPNPYGTVVKVERFNQVLDEIRDKIKNGGL